MVEREEEYKKKKGPKGEQQNRNKIMEVRVYTGPKQNDGSHTRVRDGHSPLKS
jgi:hypothetical protein